MSLFSSYYECIGKSLHKYEETEMLASIANDVERGVFWDKKEALSANWL